MEFGGNNFMTYIAGDIPVGDYGSIRLANLNLGHGAIDGGAGYTYFNPATGHEFSAVTGLTYNFTNPFTNYQSGVDWLLDWGASQFISQQVHIGLVGYVYQQLTADSGPSANSSRAFSVLDRKSDSFFQSATCRISESKGLQGIRGGEPAGGLECLGHILDANSQVTTNKNGGIFRA
jgi:hypothetical protein